MQRKSGEFQTATFAVHAMSEKVSLHRAQSERFTAGEVGRSFAAYSLYEVHQPRVSGR